MTRSTNPRDVQLKIMLTKEERERLLVMSRAMGESASTYIRRALREQIRRDDIRRKIGGYVREPDGT